MSSDVPVPAALLSLLLASAAAPASAVPAGVVGDDGDDLILIVEDGSASEPGGADALGRAPVHLRGALTSALAVDLGWGPRQDVMTWRTRVDAHLTWEPGPRWDIVLEARLEHALSAAHGSPPPGARGATRGRAEATVEVAQVRWRSPWRLDLIAGRQRILWGAADLYRPIATLNPRDLRWGPLPALDQPVVPIWALAAQWSRGPVVVEAVWAPLYAVHRAELAGSDWRLVPGVRLPGDLRQLAESLDPRRLDRHTERLIVTDPPAAGGLPGDVGVRVVWRSGGPDLALTWIHQWDRTPWVVADPARGVGYRGTLRRSHALGVDLAWSIGDLELKADAVWRSGTIAYAAAEDEPLRAWRGPALDGVVQLGWRPTIWLEVAGAVTHLRLLGGAIPEGLMGLDSPGTTHLRWRVTALLAFDGVLRLDVRGRWGLELADLLVQAAVSWRASRALALTLGVSILAGPPGGRGLGSLYRDADSAYLRATLSF